MGFVVVGRETFVGGERRPMFDLRMSDEIDDNSRTYTPYLRHTTTALADVTHIDDPLQLAADIDEYVISVVDYKLVKRPVFTDDRFAVASRQETRNERPEIVSGS